MRTTSEYGMPFKDMTMFRADPHHLHWARKTPVEEVLEPALLGWNRKEIVEKYPHFLGQANSPDHLQMSYLYQYSKETGLTVVLKGIRSKNE
ncbi:hypothetical protein KIN20_036659 [Parelaphostrongylus tenuis]|uniref:Uncharacterized protein n=1 Tax=Parelaphostrongylus tenuis TaxID=148309 RepID=A0AAD5RDQ2_PARTN|nr:hypothetical protein KIN20_036659 [Parelaphostrongylus tenuis]